MNRFCTEPYPGRGLEEMARPACPAQARGITAGHADAAREALADAGLRKVDLDGIICAYSLVEPHLMPSSVVAEYLGLRPAWSAALSVPSPQPPATVPKTCSTWRRPA